MNTEGYKRKLAAIQQPKEIYMMTMMSSSQGNSRIRCEDQMIPKNFYRLSERKITEDENGALWWEAHTGVGALKSGRCFLKGDVLFILPGKLEEPGFLKREFLEKIKKLPQWEKSRYYCLNNNIFTSESGRKITLQEIQNLSHYQVKTRYNPEWIDKNEDVSYRLRNYEIIYKTSGQLIWRAQSGYRSLEIGKCQAIEDILFIGLKEKEEPGHPKSKFLECLQQLPEWRATRYYCPNCALYDTLTGKNILQSESFSSPKEFLSTIPEEIFIPMAQKTAAYSSMPRYIRPSFIDSSASFLKQIAAKAGHSIKWKTEVEKREDEDRQKDRRKGRTSPSWLKVLNIPARLFSKRHLVVWIGVFILISGALLLFWFHDFWWHDYENHHDEYKNHHRHQYGHH